MFAQAEKFSLRTTDNLNFSDCSVIVHCSLFINDLEIYLHENPNATISLDQLSLYLLLFADDAVIFSESVEGLQTSLDSLESYCKKWNLQVNISKTKIMVFRKGGNLRQNEKWTYAGENIEIVSNFNYLGIVLSSGGSFVKATNNSSRKSFKSNARAIIYHERNASTC